MDILHRPTAKWRNFVSAKLWAPIIGGVLVMGAVAAPKPYPLLTNAVQRNDPQASTSRASMRTTGAMVTPFMSDEFANSFGVNTRFAGGIYRSQREVVENYLVDLGFRHIRDGGIFVNLEVRTYLQSLATRHGIHSSLLTRDTDTDADILAYVHDVPSLDMVEDPNELDGQPNWTDRLATFVPRLYNLVRSAPAYANIPIVGPSMGGGWDHNLALAQVLDAAKYVDYGNKHSYPAGRNPGGSTGTGDRGTGPIKPGCPAYYGGSFFADICGVQLFTKDRPIWTTETGYNSTPQGAAWQAHYPFQSLPYSVAAKYLPRLMAYEFMNGITRTYIMALVDGASGCNGPYNTDGLIEQDCPNTNLASSLHPKPAYYALKNLLAKVSDPGPAFTPTPLNLRVGGGDPKLQTMLLQKRSGEYVLLYWIEGSDWDVDKGVATPVAPESISLSIPALANHNAQQFALDPSGNLSTPQLTRFSNGTLALTATDTIGFVTFSLPHLKAP